MQKFRKKSPNPKLRHLNQFLFFSSIPEVLQLGLILFSVSLGTEIAKNLTMMDRIGFARVLFGFLIVMRSYPLEASDIERNRESLERWKRKWELGEDNLPPELAPWIKEKLENAQTDLREIESDRFLSRKERFYLRIGRPLLNLKFRIMRARERDRYFFSLQDFYHQEFVPEYRGIIQRQGEFLEGSLEEYWKNFEERVARANVSANDLIFDAVKFHPQRILDFQIGYGRRVVVTGLIATGLIGVSACAVALGLLSGSLH